MDPATALATQLFDGPPGEEAEALTHLLDDEFAELYRPLQESFLERLQPDALGSQIHRCRSCQSVCLDQYRPADGRCRVCGDAIDDAAAARLRNALFQRAESDAEAELATRISGPEGLEAAWVLASDRGFARAAEVAPRPAARAEADGAEAAEPGADEVGLEEEIDWSAKVSAVVERRRQVVAAKTERKRKTERFQKDLSWLLSEDEKAAIAAEKAEAEASTAEAAAAEAAAAEVLAAEAIPVEAAVATPTADAPASEAPVAEALPVAGEVPVGQLTSDLAETPDVPPTTPASARPSTVPPEAIGALALLIRNGPREGDELPLAPGLNKIGTGRSNDVVIRERGVGFKHALVRIDAQGVGEIEDLGAKNGIRLNGVLMPANSRAAFRPGDRLLFGTLELLYRGPEAVEEVVLPEPEEVVDLLEQPLPPAPKLDGFGLRLLNGTELGRVIELPVGESRVGTARSNEVVIRQRQVGFKHCVLKVDEAETTLEVTDLGGKGGTFLDDVRLTPKESLPIQPGQLLRLGQAELEILGPTAAGTATSAAPEPEAAAAPTGDPSRVVVGGASGAGDSLLPVGVDPLVLFQVIPEAILDLASVASRATPFGERLAREDAQGKMLVRQDAEDFVTMARDLVHSRHLPEPPDSWLLHDPVEDQWLAKRVTRRGVAVVMRCWDFLGRLPQRVKIAGGGPNRTRRALGYLLAHDTNRLNPSEVEELPAGFWRCVYDSDLGVLQGRFVRIEAISDGKIVAGSVVPRFAIRHLHADSAEDPINEAIRLQQGRNVWRPGPTSLGSTAPRFPAGGRHGRHRPRPTGAR